MPDHLKSHPLRRTRYAAVPLTPLPKALTGITGFDEITRGGLPRGRTTLVRGGPGCGKTVFAVQSLINAARDLREPGILIAFEENADQIVANAATMGWDLPALAARRLFILDGGLTPEMVQAKDFDVSGLINVLMVASAEIGAKRIVLDGIDVLLRLLEDPNAERREMYRIRDWLSRSRLTAIVTQKVLENSDHSPNHQGFMSFMADCVVNLSHQVVDGSAFRNVRVMKYRGSGFMGDEFPLTIGSTGIQVTHRGPTELDYPVTNARVSSGLPRLDMMLGGGYYRGSNVLISGAPGTAKSTLAGLFIEASCQRGERAVYVSFDEGSSQIVRNLASVGIKLAGHQKSGALKIYATRTRGLNIEDQFGELRALIARHDPKTLVIDPLSALATKLAHAASADATQAFLDHLKAKGITVVNTSLIEGSDAAEVTATGISTIADTWIHMSYLTRDGERNRALTIVKSRGTGHSNQVRELTLSKKGVALTDVYTAHGEVLMGVARWEREREERLAKKRTLGASVSARLKLRLAQAEAAARLQVVRAEMEARSAEIALLDTELASASEISRTDRATLRGLRHADDGADSAPAPDAAKRKKVAKKRAR